MYIKIILAACLLAGLFSCKYTTQCQRHYIPQGFTGRVVIYHDQKKAVAQTDNEGCIVYRISGKGECFSPLPYKTTVSKPDETIRYFEVIDNNYQQELFRFQESKYLVDTVSNGQRKYIFLISAGYDHSIEYEDYYVDYGKNYQDHFY